MIKVRLLKQLLTDIFKIHVLFNLHVALSVVALYVIFNDQVNETYVHFLFFSTVLGYGFIRLFNFEGNRFFIKKFYVRYKYLFASLLFISATMSIWYYFHLKPYMQLRLIPFFAISFFYNYHFKFAPFLRLRNNGIVKIISVALVWAGLTVWVRASFETGMLLKFLFVFMYVLMLTMSFDQRDLYIDKQELKTIPQIFTSGLVYIYLIIASFLFILSLYIFTGIDLIISIFIVILSVILCYFSNDKKSYYYTAFWIEGLALLWFLLLYLT